MYMNEDKYLWCLAVIAIIFLIAVLFFEADKNLRLPDDKPLKNEVSRRSVKSITTSLLRRELAQDERTIRMLDKSTYYCAGR